MLIFQLTWFITTCSTRFSAVENHKPWKYTTKSRCCPLWTFLKSINTSLKYNEITKQICVEIKFDSIFTSLPHNLHDFIQENLMNSKLSWLELVQLCGKSLAHLSQWEVWSLHSWASPFSNLNWGGWGVRSILMPSSWFSQQTRSFPSEG